MPFTIDFPRDGTPVAWTLSGTVDDPAWTATSHPDYHPRLFVATAHGMQDSDPDPTACVEALEDLRADLDPHPAVASCSIERWRPGFRFATQPMLAVAVDRVDRVQQVARFVERRGPPGRVPYRAFDVDFTPEFRFCLDRGVSPRPSRPPRVLRLALSREAAATEDLTALAVGPEAVAPTATDATCAPPVEPAGATELAALRTLRDRLGATDPDVLVVDHADIVPLVADAASDHGIDLGLARTPDVATSLPPHQRLAGDSTFESYGQVRHSPARYNVPGRVVVDRSNTFFLRETNLAGALDLVARSRKPLQELSWASIGNVLTAIQIREARARGVRVQWRAWRPERFKTAATLHDADRGGTTLSPVVGVHEDVHELDFASLYPNIICQHNLSPETVRCGCHDRADVPDLGYAVCDEPGYLPDVLQPLIDARAGIKERLATADLAPAERAALEGQSSALKWILVSCFGYQGFANAKFGRIEVHEAINAYARDVLLTAKEELEAAGWRVLHGIVDSIWVTPREADPRPLEAVADAITESVGITLEHEGAFEWVAFCPRRDGDAGALTRYFGRRRDAGDDPYKTRGIECRQRSTCAWVARVQRDLIAAFDESRAPERVCDRLAAHCHDLQRGAVPTTDLVVTTRASKAVEAYTRSTRTVAALRRADDRGVSTAPGQDVRYVVVDDAKRGRERVRLAAEVDDGTAYDVQCYRERAVRAAESVLSPLGWDSERIASYLDERENAPLREFVG